MNTATELDNVRQVVTDAKNMAGAARQRHTDRTPAEPQPIDAAGDLSCAQLHLAASIAYLHSAEAYLAGNPPVGEMYSHAGNILAGAAKACESLPAVELDRFRRMLNDARYRATAARQQVAAPAPAGQEPLTIRTDDIGCMQLHLAAALAYLQSAEAYLQGNQVAGDAYSAAGDLLAAEAILVCEVL